MRVGLLEAAGLGLDAVRHPSLVPTLAPIIRHPLRSNWDAGEPWWNSRAIAFLAECLPPQARVFEWGSGGSTVWLCAQGAQVTSVESESQWAELVRGRCPSAEIHLVPGAPSGKRRSEPQLRDRGRHFFDEYVEAIDSFDECTYDVIVIDGICRTECAIEAVPKLKRDGLVILDDTNWEFVRSAERAFEGWPVRRIRGFKRRSGGVWETSFFRRPMAGRTVFPELPKDV